MYTDNVKHTLYEGRERSCLSENTQGRFSQKTGYGVRSPPPKCSRNWDILFFLSCLSDAISYCAFSTSWDHDGRVYATPAHTWSTWGGIGLPGPYLHVTQHCPWDVQVVCVDRMTSAYPTCTDTRWNSRAPSVAGHSGLLSIATDFISLVYTYSCTLQIGVNVFCEGNRKGLGGSAPSLVLEVSPTCSMAACHHTEARGIWRLLIPTAATLSCGQALVLLWISCLQEHLHNSCWTRTCWWLIY